MYTKKGLVAPEEKQRRRENAKPREMGQWNWYIMAPSSYPRTCTLTHTRARARTHLSCVIVIYNNNSNDWHCVCIV